MTTRYLHELEELAMAIEEAEGLDPHAARRKAEQIMASLQRQAYQWDSQAYAAENETAINIERN